MATLPVRAAPFASAGRGGTGLSEFHYVRTLGVDGGVDAVEGPAVGLDLDSVLKDGLPPFKVALEVIAAVCEILDIADQDGEVHGDLSPRWVFLDETGAVSVEGFGARRSRSSAPERQPQGTATDVYGLGTIAFRLFSPRELGALPDDADGHDDAVIDAIVGLNFEGLPEEIIGDIQWFLAKALAHEREERPTAVEVWRTFIAFADSVPGPRLDDWANDVINGAGERRDAEAAAKRPTPPPEADEDLGGPVMMKGPLSKGIDLSSGGKKGQATAFWSKDQMKAALDAQEQDEEEGFKPAVGGGSATSFWTREQMQAMSEGRADAPRPKRRGGGKGGAGPVTDEEPAPSKPQPAPTKIEPAPKRSTPMPPASRGNDAPASRPAAAPSNPSASPFAAMASGPVAAPAPVEEPAQGGGMGKIVAIAVVVLLVLSCGGVFLLGGGTAALYALIGATTPPTAPVPTAPSSSTAPATTATETPSTASTDTPAGATASGSAATPPTGATKTSSSSGSSTKSSTKSSSSSSGSSTKSSSSSSTTTSASGTSSSGSSKVRPPSDGSSSSASTSSGSTSSSGSSSSVRPSNGSSSSTTTAAAATTATTGPVKITLKAAGRGNAKCSDGQTVPFDGVAAFEVDPTALPVSCIVTMDGKRGVFQRSAGGVVNCSLSGDEVSCS